jgi:hypothetical protein
MFLELAVNAVYEFGAERHLLLQRVHHLLGHTELVHLNVIAEVDGDAECAYRGDRTMCAL